VLRLGFEDGYLSNRPRGMDGLKMHSTSTLVQTNLTSCAPAGPPAPALSGHPLPRLFHTQVLAKQLRIPMHVIRTECPLYLPDGSQVLQR
jgi:hypothetical protein